MTSRLDYCNALLAGCFEYILDAMQLIQNAAARLVTRTRKRQHISPVLVDLHWLKIRERVSFKLALLVYKSLNQQAPPYLSKLCVYLSDVSGRSGLRSHAAGKLAVPQTRTMTYGNTPFCVAGPLLWNDLPLTIRDSSSTELFKRDLKTHLFKTYF